MNSPLVTYKHLIKLRNARVEHGLPLAYGTGTNDAPRKIDKERIQKLNKYKYHTSKK